MHDNLCGKMLPQALGGTSFFFLLVDDFSRKMLGYFLHDKAQDFGKFKEWLQLVENKIGNMLKKFKIDCGGHLTSKEFEYFSKGKGIN